MPDARKIHEILGILLARCEEPSPDCAADHDVIYLPGPHPDKFSQEEKAKLEELGAFWSEEVDSWKAFV